MAGMIPEGGFKDRDGFRAWLESLDEDQRVPFARVLAHRAALRVLPFVASSLGNWMEIEAAETLITSVFRANAVSRVLCTTPSLQYSRFAIDAALAADECAIIADRAASHVASGRARNAARSSYSATDAASTSAAIITTDSAAHVVMRSIRASAFGTDYRAAGSGILEVIKFDARMFENVGSSKGFEDTPLWPVGAPVWWTEQYQKLQAALWSDVRQKEHWAVWLNWYGAIVSGQSPWNLPRATASEIEKRIALGDGRDDFWDTKKRTVAEINAEIARWVEEARPPHRIEPEASEQTPESGKNAQKPDSWRGESTPVTVPPKSITENRLAVRIQVGGLRSTVAAERKLLGDKPNDPLRLDEWERKSELLEKLENGLAAVEANLPVEADGKPREGDEIAASQLQALANEFRQWLNTNRPEMVDWALRLGSASLFIGLMSFLGATMPVATSVILAMTCGTKARDVILGKRKEKDEEKTG